MLIKPQTPTEQMSKMFLILLMSVLLRFVVTSEVGGPKQILHELNLALRMELNVFINLEDCSQGSSILYSLDTPRIQLYLNSNETMHFRIHGNFTKKALTIIQLMDLGLDPKVFNFLPLLLHRHHELHIAFLSKKNPEFLQKELYTYCYKEGFINVILIHNSDLYSYLPYPSIEPIKLANISEYLRRVKILRNFKGYPIRILRSDLKPRDFEYFNDRNELVRGGYVFAAAKEFIDRYNASLTSVPSPQLPKTDYEKYRAVAGMILSKEIDLICYYKDINMEWDYPYTEPLSIIRSYLIVPHARPISSYLYYSRPFRWSLWLVVAFTIFFGAMMLFLGSEGHRNDIGKCLLYSLSHILNTCNQVIRTAGWRDQLIHAILSLGGFMLTNLYLATLSSILTSGLYEPQYKTIEDLVDVPYPSLHDEFYLKQFRANTYLPEALRRNSVAMSGTLVKTYRDTLNRSFIYLCAEDRLDLILMQQYLLKTPRFDVIRQGVSFSLEAYYVSRSLPYLNMVSEFMRRLQEHGINIKMKADTFWIMIERRMLTLMPDEEPQAKAFDLQFYYFAFALWGAGLAISLLVFIVEFYYT